MVLLLQVDWCVFSVTALANVHYNITMTDLL